MWRLCDLHNHTTPNEKCDSAWDPEAFVRSCVEAGLDVVAVTDHDHCDHVEDALAAAATTSLTVIPGVELSTDHGHILALAPGDGGCEIIQSFCTRVGAVPGDQIKFDTVTGAFGAKRDAGQFFSEEIVLIGAHVDAPSSILSNPSPMSLDGQLEAARHLHALEVSNDERLVEWQTAGVKQSKERFTLLRGSDTHDPAARTVRGTWIYLPRVNSQDLRHALAIPESSLSVAPDRPASQEFAVEYIEFEDGHHSGERFDFSERANAVIGPPNAGKSLLIDAFKFAFGLECDIAEVEQITAARMSKTMPKGAVVRLGLRTPDGPTVIERTVGGSDRPIVPFQPIIFSQTELTRRSIAAEPAIQLLDIHCPTVEDAKELIRQRAEVVERLFLGLCEAAIKSRELAGIVENPEDGLAATERSIKDLAGHESVATNAMNLEKVSGWQADVAAAIDDWLSGFDGEALVVPSSPELAESELDLSSLAPVEAMRGASVEAHKLITDAVASAKQRLSSVFDPAVADLETQRAAADDELEKHGFDRGSELVESVRRLQVRLGKLEREKTELDGLKQDINEGLVTLKDALAAVDAGRSALSDERKAGCKRVNESMHSFFAKVDPAGMTENLDALFDDLKTGTKMQPGTRKRALDGLDRMRFMEVAVRELQGQPISAHDNFAEQDRVVAEALEREKHAQVAELSCCFPGDKLDLMWKEEKPPTPFSGLTEGLRALAIKEISFAASTLPVISDQPEAAVPTRPAFTSPVPTLREQRRNRQFIVVSHDANIVVTSDVEQILVLEGNEDGTHSQGGLFDPSIQAAALEHLEGGRQAFMLRSDRYGKAKV